MSTIHVHVSKKHHRVSDASGPSDRYLDLLKQGFMKPAKSKNQKMWQHWLPNGEGMSYEGPNEMMARTQMQRYGGEVKQITKTADAGEGSALLAQAEQAVGAAGKTLRLAQESGDKVARRAALAAYETVRNEYDRLFNLQKLAQINAGRNMKAEREHAAMLHAPLIHRQGDDNEDNIAPGYQDRKTGDGSDELWDSMMAASKNLNEVKRRLIASAGATSSMGMTPDVVKQSPEFQGALRTYQKAEAQFKASRKAAKAGDAKTSDFDPAQAVKIAADDITKLRKQDVYRVLEQGAGANIVAVAAYIKAKRPDLAAEVDECKAELTADSKTTDRAKTTDSAERREPPTIDSIGEEKGLAAGKPVNTEWLRLDKLTPEALAAEAKGEGIKGEGKTDLIMAILRKNFSTAQFDAWSLFY